MLLNAWHDTDPNYSVEEQAHEEPRMVNAINIGFDPTSRSEHHNCSEYEFIRCSHCGRLLCLHHFLERECFHNHSPRSDRRDNSSSEAEVHSPASYRGYIESEDMEVGAYMSVDSDQCRLITTTPSPTLTSRYNQLRHINDPHLDIHQLFKPKNCKN